MTAEVLFIVVIATFSASGDAATRFFYATPDQELACSIKALGSSDRVHINVNRAVPVAGGRVWSSGEWCPPPKAKEPEPFDFGKLLDEVQAQARAKVEEARGYCLDPSDYSSGPCTPGNPNFQPINSKTGAVWSR